MTDGLVFRLRERARIRRQIPGRKSVEEGKPDRIADLLEEAADALEPKSGVVDDKGLPNTCCYKLDCKCDL